METLLGFHRLLAAALLTAGPLAPAFAGAISATVSVGVTVLQSSGVCGATSGTSTISVTCVGPGPLTGDPEGSSPPGAGAGASPPVLPPPVAGGPGSGGGGVVPIPNPAPPVVPVGTPALPPGDVTPVAPGPGTAQTPPLVNTADSPVTQPGGAIPGLPGVSRFSAAAHNAESQALSETLRRVFLLPTLVPGAVPILVYSSRAEISGSRNVSHDNGSYLELTISW